MKKIISIVVLLIAAYFGYTQDALNFLESQNTTIDPDLQQVDQILSEAFRNQTSDLQVSGTATVDRILADDTKGSQHQRFIVRLHSGQTVMFAHNIDLAPRINGLREGDSISFSGEYEWNERGGVIHWTHRDPAGRHINGWIKHQGKTYQ